MSHTCLPATITVSPLGDDVFVGDLLGHIALFPVLDQSQPQRMFHSLFLYSVPDREGTSNIEESQGVVYFDIVRKQGSMGWVSVDFMTVGDTAIHQQGTQIYTAQLHQVCEA